MRHILKRCCFTLLALSLAMGSGHADDVARDSLRILVYGATGKVGVHVVDEGLSRGHHVTAVSRDPARIEQSHENLTPIQGDILDAGSVALLLPGHDVVIVSVRGVTGRSKSPEDAVALIGVKNVVDALRDMQNQPPRLIHVGGSGSLEVRTGVVRADTLPKIFLPKRLEIEIAGQIKALDYLRGVSDVQWTYATPPRNFTNGERSGEYRIGGDRLMEDARGRSRVSRVDFAVALIDEAESAAHQQKRFSVAY